MLRKQKLLVYMNKAQKRFGPHPNPKNGPIGPKKAQNDPKKSKKKSKSQKESTKRKVISLHE